ncbi:MAG: cytidylate kinase family protein [Candidatus Moranbacteria bacterium]|nr:cytidylate kinase family protein [Candidatus Moranbacteria bacterium]
MIISFNGDEGSGKSTIAEKVAQELGYPRYYMGQIFRDMAKKKGMTIAEYVKSGEKDPNVDKEVDDYFLQLAKEQDDFVLESRTAWHLLPQSLKIYLKVEESEGVKRIHKALQKDNSRNEIRNLDSIETVLKNIDDTRYKKYYGINIRDMKKYDFVLDTTKLTREEVFKKTISFIKKHINS